MQVGLATKRLDLEQTIERLTHMTVYGYTITPSSVIDLSSNTVLLNGLPTKDEVIKGINDHFENLNVSPKMKYYIEELRSIEGDDACGYSAANGHLIPVKHLVALDEENSKKINYILNMNPNLPRRISSYLYSKLTGNSTVHKKLRSSIESGEIKTVNQIDFLDYVYSPKNFERKLRGTLIKRYGKNLSMNHTGLFSLP